jgi:imidazole glycerol-phosphate synthase subunit HisH
MIGILDIQMGNLRSLSKAVYSLGYDFKLVRLPADLEDATHLMVPGVGAYRTAMQHLDEQGLPGAICAFAASGRPVAGICLGMQLLSSSGEEGGPSEGLGLIPGKVARMRPQGDLHLPHVGWNTTRFKAKHPIFHKVKDGLDFYYVHSYHFTPNDPAHTLATCEYGQHFTSIAGCGNVIGFQFHPEKSQANGLKLIENFCDWDGKC